ncbi:MAG: M48 family metallopeptidase [Pseudomonadota bacterium]|uniref:M48 family metallopeptidase n=1 Tax=unclassified Phenylobacterium TaxID=2640670 RepID=UPI0006F5F04A|nr:MULTISPECIES: M48 family metallopeptidase [unclassified Phenylobacterium]KRB40016.1 peptidase M48 [Phenylobacterium sp. Root700]MBT9469660.1 M48 family metallopeptidase [Phenylobacterium sp.]
MAQGFDPVAATAAYLAQLPPEAHAKATDYTQGGHWLLLWSALVAVVVAWLVLRSGVLVGVRNKIESRKARPWLAVAAVLLVDGVLETLLTLPWTAYANWWREKSYGLTSQPLGGFLGEFTLSAVIYIVVMTLMFSLLYWLMRRTARSWWLWGGGVVAGFLIVTMVLAPVLVQPLFNTYKEAPHGEVRDAIVEMAKANGVPHDKIFIYDGSKQSNRYTANVSGLFGTARIAMSDVMFTKGADLAEVRGVVGHEMGHYVHMHTIWMSLAFGTLALIGFFLVDRLFMPVLRLTGAKGITGLSDPAGFPVIGILMAVLGLLASPIVSSIVRQAEVDADRYSLEHVNEPDGLAKALVKTIEYRAATPSKLEETLFYDHPAVGSRVRMAMDWKAAQSKVDEVR